MKLIVQIPALNEEETLEAVIPSIPNTIPGVTELLVVVIDDPSTDKTVEIAQNLGVAEVIRHR